MQSSEEEKNDHQHAVDLPLQMKPSDDAVVGATEQRSYLDGTYVERPASNLESALHRAIASPLGLQSPMDKDQQQQQQIENSQELFRGGVNSTQVQTQSFNNSITHSRGYYNYGNNLQQKQQFLVNTGNFKNPASFNRQTITQMLIRPQSAVATALSVKKLKKPQYSQLTSFYPPNSKATLIQKKNQTPGNKSSVTKTSGTTRSGMQSKRSNNVSQFNKSYDLRPGTSSAANFEQNASFGIISPIKTSKQGISSSQIYNQRSSKTTRHDLQMLSRDKNWQNFQATFGTRDLAHHQQTFVQTLLGPGTYDPQVDTTKPRAPSALIIGAGTSENNSNFETANLGPGIYQGNSDTFGKDGAKITIHQKLSSPGNHNPGPGQYNPKYDLIKSAPKGSRISPSRSQRGLIHKEAILSPGPGTYDISMRNIGIDGPTYSIQSSKRDLQYVMKTPGPGAYNQPSIDKTREKTPEYSIPLKQKSQIKSRAGERIPGPGNYAQRSFVGKEGPKYSIKGLLSPKKRDNAPGPGYYNPNEQVIKEKVKSVKITSNGKPRYPVTKRDDVPPPGIYNIQSTIGQDGPKYSIAQRNLERAVLSPGPGYYMPDGAVQFTKIKSSAYKIGSSKRVSEYRDRNPGPGFYQTIETFGQNAPKISILGKLQTKSGNYVPGPGQYQPAIDPVKQRPKSVAKVVSKRADVVQKEQKLIPGPGTYESPTRFGQGAPMMSILSKLDDGSRNQNPGPGYYCPTDILVKDRSPMYKIDGSTERLKSVSNERLLSPGPGAYNPKKDLTIDAPIFYTIGERHPGRDDNGIPGPGQYNPNPRIIQTTSPERSFPKTDRQSLTNRDHYPGPGVYDPVNQRFIDISYKFSGSERPQPMSRDARANPGPGQYAYDKEFGQDGVKYTIQRKILARSYDSFPGPGYYNQHGTFAELKSPLGIIHPEHPENFERLTPGPGYYHAVDHLTRQKSPEIAIGGKSNRLEAVSRDQKVIPGPGTYSLKQIIGGDGSIKYSIAFKPNSRNDNGNPGPGQYNPNDSIIRERSSEAIMSRSKRGLYVSKSMSSLPSPGYYDPVDNRYPNISYQIAHGQRLSPVSKDQRLNPGPAHYSSPDRFGKDGIQYTIRRKTQSPSREAFPGPGYYKPQAELIQRRIQLGVILPYKEIRRIRMTPGPGYYNPEHSFVLERSPDYKIGGLTERPSSIPKEQREYPGPGHYTQRNLLGGDESIKYTIGTRIEGPSGPKNPGPGHYQHIDLTGKDAPKYTIGERHDPRSADYVPGPGHYNPENQLVVERSILGKINPEGVSPRGNNNPGPGHYNPDDAQTYQQSPQYRIGDALRNGPLKDENPGPGHYNQRDYLGANDSQKFTIGERIEGPRGPNNPGPGYYQPNDQLVYDQAPSYKIGESERGGIPHENNPGPGHYNQRDYLGGKDSRFFTIGDKIEGPRNPNYPGPGYYNPDDDLTYQQSPQYKIGEGERNPMQRDDNPGPGHYDQRQYIGEKDSRFFKIGEKLPDPRDQGYPGPGSYQPNDQLIYEQAPQYRVPQGERMPGISGDSISNPGPGQYNQRQLIGGPDTRFFTISERYEGPRDPNNPGPGTYNPDDGLTYQQSPQYRIGQSERPSNISGDAVSNPAPGQYDQRQIIGAPDSRFFKIGERIQGPRDSNYPGPGQYNPDDALTYQQSPQYKIGESERVPNITGDAVSNPGPGQYNQRQYIGATDTRFVTIGERIEGPRDPNNPGPGHYSPSFDFTVERAPQYQIGGAADRPEAVSRDQALNPGPGTYNLKQYLGGDDSISFKIGEKRDLNPDNHIPGPGHYNPNHSLTEENFEGKSFPKSDRPSQVPNEVRNLPGPGIYNSNYEKFPNIIYTVSQAERPNTVSRDARNNPGPANYNHSVEFGSDAPQFKIGERHPDRSFDNYPGPAHYKPNDTLVEPRSSHGIINPINQFDGIEHSKSPGPAYYNPDHTIVQERTAAIKIGKNKRDFLTIGSDVSQLGPGSYNPHLPTDVHSFTIGERNHQGTANMNPGPGAYSIDFNLTEIRSPQHDFTKSPERPDNVSSEDQQKVRLGPGAYNPNDTFIAGNTSISYSISKGERDVKVDNNPGPGDYKIPVKFAAQQLYAIPIQNEEFKYV